MLPDATTCFVVACGLATLWLDFSPCRAADDASVPPTAAQAQRLVRDLGHASFRIRERATRQLVQLGVPAKDALMLGLKDSDAEIRERCRRVLVGVLEEDYQARVDAFAADRQGSKEHDLPGWDRYRQVVGDGSSARELFVEMQRAESKLLECAAADAEAAGALLGIRCEDLQQAVNRPFDDEGKPLALGSIAAVFFVAGDTQVPINDRLSAYLHNFSYQNNLQTALRGGSKIEPLKRILGAWILRGTSLNNAYPGLRLAMEYDLREGLQPALKLIKQPAFQPQFMQFALLVIGKFGDKQHIETIEPLLTNTTQLFTQSLNGQQMRCEVRDVTLAVLIHLSGQQFKDYGLERVQKNTQMLFNTSSIGFATESDRDEAIKKWKAWSAEHPSRPGAV